MIDKEELKDGYYWHINSKYEPAMCVVEDGFISFVGSYGTSIQTNLLHVFEGKFIPIELPKEETK